MAEIIVNEIWKSIDGYLNYQVSNMGRVRNCNTGRILRPRMRGKGYETVALYENKVRSDFSVHRLVAQEFVKNKKGKPFVDHIDGNKLNNMATNLRWCTNQENVQNTGKINKQTSSRYKGVSWNIGCKKWIANIAVNGKKEHLGCFDDEEEAARVYNEHAIEYFGKFANINTFD